MAIGVYVVVAVIALLFAALSVVGLFSETEN